MRTLRPLAARFALLFVFSLAVLSLAAEPRASGAVAPGEGPDAGSRPVYDDNDEPFIGPPFIAGNAPLAELVDDRVLRAPDRELRALALAVREGRASKQMLRAFFEAYSLHFPFEEPVPRDWRRRAFSQLEQSAARRRAAAPDAALAAPGPTWLSAGPTNVGGRVTAIAIHPTNPDLAYVGAADGGVWRLSFDPLLNAASWTPLFDAEPTLSIGALALDPSNPDKLFVGTGELNFAIDNYYGMGLIISTDAGRSFGAPIPIGNATRIGALVVRPDNSSIVFAGTSAGLYKSADGGLSWTQVLGGGAATGLVLDPASPDTVYVGLRASGTSPSGIWKSTTGGDAGSFVQLQGGGACTLPVLGAGVRIALAIAASRPSVVYAALDLGQGEIWKSTDAGLTWCPQARPGNFCNAQCWYDMTIAVDPQDPDHVLAGGLYVYRSTNGGGSWSEITPRPHVDHHVLEFAPNGARVAYNGNDGGPYRFEIGALGLTVRNLEGGFVTAQYYGMGHDPADRTYVYGGTQDNGTQRFSEPATNTSAVQLVGCGDGAAIRVNPLMNRIYVTACPAGGQLQLGVSDDRGQNTSRRTSGINLTESASWVTPLELFDSKTLYTATNDFVYVTRNADATPSNGITWSPLGQELTPPGVGGTISTIASTPADPLTLWAGTSSGRVYQSVDGGASWVERWQASGGRSRYIGKVAASPTDANTAWIALGGLGGAFDTGGHVFETTNGGLTWSDMSGDLPDVPVHALLPDPRSPDRFWAGSWVGVFRTENHGANWVHEAGVPNSAIVEMAYDATHQIVYAATHGRGLWKLEGPVSAPPRPVPDGVIDLGRPMYATKQLPAATVEVSWGVTGCPGSVDYHLFWGDLVDRASYAYAGAACGLGTSGTASFTPPAGSVFWLMAGTNAVGDESGHRRADGGGWLPITAGSTCPGIAAQDLSLGCP